MHKITNKLKCYAKLIIERINWIIKLKIEVTSEVTELIGNLKAKNMNGEPEMKPREMKKKKKKGRENDQMKENQQSKAKEKGK